MDQYELIRTAHQVYKKSIRQIARETGHTRRTIRKVLAGQEPRYRREKEPACPVMDGVNGNRTLHTFLTIRSGAEVRVRTTGPRVAPVAGSGATGGGHQRIDRFPCADLTPPQARLTCPRRIAAGSGVLASGSCCPGCSALLPTLDTGLELAYWAELGANGDNDGNEHQLATLRTIHIWS